jgi:hypothetical protein
MLIMPQIIQIVRTQKVEGISYHLIGLNLGGDIFKTIFFFYKVSTF